MTPLTDDPVEMVARVLAQLPSDPGGVLDEDLVQLLPIQGALAAEAQEIRARLAALADQLDDLDGLTVTELLAAAREQQRLQTRHGRLEIASVRLDHFTVACFTARGMDLNQIAAEIAGDSAKETQ